MHTKLSLHRATIPDNVSYVITHDCYTLGSSLPRPILQELGQKVKKVLKGVGLFLVLLLYEPVRMRFTEAEFFKGYLHDSDNYRGNLHALPVLYKGDLQALKWPCHYQRQVH